MHAPSLHKWHLFDHSIDHQKLTEALLLLVFIGSIAVVTAHVESLYAPEIGLETGMSQLVAGNVEPLTRLTDPAYAHEYPQRATFMTTTLEGLLETSQVERVYAVVYEYAEPTVIKGSELHVSEIFEVRQTHIAPRFKNFDGMSRRNWLQIHQDERMLSKLSHNFFQSYGLELLNERGVAIAHIGFERRRGDKPFQDWEIAQLRETATIIEQSLLQPLASLEQPLS